MGNTCIPVKAMLDDLGLNYEIPSFNTPRSIAEGARIAPESACLPLKANLGNFIQAACRGADTVIIPGGCGPCRFGLYSEMHRQILKEHGYDMDILALEIPRKNPQEFIRRIRILTGETKLFEILRIASRFVRIAGRMDALEQQVRLKRPRENDPGKADRIYAAFRRDVFSRRGSQEILALIRKTRMEIASIPELSCAAPLRIGIVGEIFTNIDQETCLHLEAKLGRMGVEVHRPITLSSWIQHHMIRKALHLPERRECITASRLYMGAMIGGHARETVGNSVLFAKQGFDGIIQTYPLTCMPEITAQSILPSVTRDLGIPVMTLVLDEISGEAGFQTRLEAFTDMLMMRREQGTIKLTGRTAGDEKK